MVSNPCMYSVPVVRIRRDVLESLLYNHDEGGCVQMIRIETHPLGCGFDQYPQTHDSLEVVYSSLNLLSSSGQDAWFSSMRRGFEPPWEKTFYILHPSLPSDKGVSFDTRQNRIYNRQLYDIY